MATPLDASQFEEVPGAPQATGPIGNPTPQGAGLKPLDPSQIESLPSYANGSSPLTPVNSSPVSATDQALLSLGNKAGQLKYLKANFDDAVQDKDGDLLVKKDDIWHRVNPTNLGEPDAWAATRKIVKSLVPAPLKAMAAALDPSNVSDPDTISGANLEALGQKISGMAGSALPMAGGLAGAVAGGGTASVAAASSGAGAGEALRTSLGRLAGTYEATPEQQAKDIGWEGLLAGGGQTVALGVKPALGMMKTALKGTASTMTNWGKEQMSHIWGTLIGENPTMVRRAMDFPDEVIGHADRALQAIGPDVAPDEARGVLAQNQASIVRGMAAQAQPALSAQYRSDMGTLLKQIPNDFSADIGDMMTGVQKGMADTGYGTFDSGGKFKLYSDADIAHRMGVSEAELPKIMGPNTRDAVEQLTDLTRKYSQFGTLNGPSGAGKLLELKKAVGETFSDLLDSDSPDAVKKAVMNIKSSWDSEVGQQFSDHGAYDAYSALNKNYSANVDAVTTLRNAVDRGQEDSLVKHLVSKAGANESVKTDATTVAKLLGPNGANSLANMSNMEAAKSFTGFVPHGGGNSAISSMRAVAGVAQQTNPQLVGKQIAFGGQLVDFMKSLPPKQIKQLMGNDQALSQMITPLMQSYDGEDHAVQGLLQQAGVNVGQVGGAVQGAFGGGQQQMPRQQQRHR